MFTSLLAALAISNGIGYCDTIAQIAHGDEKQVAANTNNGAKHEHKAAPKNEGTLETRIDELGAAIQNLSKQISTNTKRGAKTADERIRREFETIKKGLVEATSSAEAKAKETGSEASSELKTALQRLSKSIDELANKVSKQ